MLKTTTRQNLGNASYLGATGSLPLVLAKSAIPFINVSSGTMGNNGALSAITALPRTYSGGAYIFLPAGAIAAGVPAAAAWYWCVFSSATAGTVYNSVYTSGVPVIGTTTAFATTGPGAFTGDTSEQGPLISLPANSLGANGQIRVSFEYSFTNNANTKTHRVRLGGLAGTGFFAANQTTGIGVRGVCIFGNCGLTNVQYGSGWGIGDGGGIFVAKSAGSVDTTASSSVVATLAKGTATDNITLESFMVELIPG